MRKLLYNYKLNCKKIQDIREKIEYLKAQAEKITPTLSEEKGGGSFEVKSKIEENVIKLLELESKLKFTQDRVKRCDDFLESLKPYQRYIVTSCIVNHIPYEVIAKREKTTPQNISKIIHKVL